MSLPRGAAGGHPGHPAPGGRRWRGLLSQLLLLARADSGRQTLRREAVNLSEMAVAVADEQRELAADKRITVTAQITPRPGGPGG